MCGFFVFIDKMYQFNRQILLIDITIIIMHHQCSQNLTNIPGSDNSNLDVYPVLDEPNVSMETDSSDQSSFNIKDKLCVESSIPGLYRCYR